MSKGRLSCDDRVMTEGTVFLALTAAFIYNRDIES